jgi:hypothetical protein
MCLVFPVLLSTRALSLSLAVSFYTFIVVSRVCAIVARLGKKEQKTFGFWPGPPPQTTKSGMESGYGREGVNPVLGSIFFFFGGRWLWMS